MTEQRPHFSLQEWLEVRNHHKEEIERLTRERDIAEGSLQGLTADYVKASAERDALRAERDRIAQESADLLTQYCKAKDAAEAALAKAREALEPFARVVPATSYADDDALVISYHVGDIRRAHAALAAIPAPETDNG